MPALDRILVIKLGALGDFVQALGPMQAIQRHHTGAAIDLLTTEPFADFADATGLFATILSHGRMKWHQIGRIRQLRHDLRQGNYLRVYDLQTSDRSSLYYRLFWPGPYPEWSGIAAGCSHPHANSERDRMHTFERQAEQLANAGVSQVLPPNLEWASADLGRFALDGPYVALIPGGAPHRPDKRWPAERYGELAKFVFTSGRTPILLGSADEHGLHDGIIRAAPGARSFAGKTSLLELASLIRGADFAVGNDTGPMHIAAVSGIPTVVLYSHASDPALCAQRGPRVHIHREPLLSDISVELVTSKLSSFLHGGA